jgi:putative flippase GtrA
MNNPFGAVGAQRPVVQLARYGLVGLASNLSGYLVYVLITYWGSEPKRTMTLLYIVGASIGYFGNRQWTFAHKGGLGAGARYLIAHLLGYLINLLLLFTFVDRLGYSHQWVQAVAIFIVAGFLFLAFKYFVFHKSEV